VAAFLDSYVVLFRRYSEKNHLKAYANFSAYLGRGVGGISDVGSCEMLPYCSHSTPGGWTRILLLTAACSWQGSHKDGVSEQSALCDFHFVVNSRIASRSTLSKTPVPSDRVTFSWKSRL
jgi:hypothetical protein